MNDAKFDNFLKILELYKLKQVARASTNNYKDDKDNINHSRRETTAEHVYSCLKLADYFLTNEPEFANLNRIKVYDLLLYHDDVEIIAKDTEISKVNERRLKDKKEREAIPVLYERYPSGLDEKLIVLDSEYREGKTLEAKFAKAIDKMDSLVHELQYPLDWGPKGYDEKNVRKWFQPDFKYSRTFMEYFEGIIDFLSKNDYFNK